LDARITGWPQKINFKHACGSPTAKFPKLCCNLVTYQATSRISLNALKTLIFEWFAPAAICRWQKFVQQRV